MGGGGGVMMMNNYPNTRKVYAFLNFRFAKGDLP